MLLKLNKVVTMVFKLNKVVTIVFKLNKVVTSAALNSMVIPVCSPSVHSQCALPVCPTSVYFRGARDPDHSRPHPLSVSSQCLLPVCSLSVSSQFRSAPT